MILGLGSDIIENERIAEIYKKHGERFLKRIFTKGEIEYSLRHSDPVPYLAARFAVKEAAIKALNLQRAQSFSWKDVEVCGKTFGKKKLSFHNQALAVIKKMKVSRQHISLSHCGSFSIAVVVLETK